MRKGGGAGSSNTTLSSFVFTKPSQRIPFALEKQMLFYPNQMTELLWRFARHQTKKVAVGVRGPFIENAQCTRILISLAMYMPYFVHFLFASESERK